MKDLTIFNNLLIVIFLAAASLGYPQDSSKFVILSENVGSTLDAEEREKYGIFGRFEEEFVSAVFYLAPDSNYYCKINFKFGTMTEDSTFIISFASMRSMSARIRYIESQERGDPEFDFNRAVLKFADGTDAVNYESERDKSTRKIEEIPLYKRKLPTNRLDLDYSGIIGKKFRFGLSVAAGYNNTELEGLAELFNMLEQYIPQEGYEVPKSDHIYKASPMIRFSSMLFYRDIFIAEIEYGLNIRNNASSGLDMRSFVVSFSYIIPILNNPSPYVSLGYSASHFTVTKNYNTVINKNNGRLESIKIDGNSKGIRTSLGIIYRFSVYSGFRIFADYLFYSDAKVDQDMISNNYSLEIPRIPSVNLNRFEIGIGLFFRI